MGYIKEPKGVDLIVAPSVLTEQDLKMISEIIADYKRTGKLPVKNKRKTLRDVLIQSGRLDKKQTCARSAPGFSRCRGNPRI